MSSTTEQESAFTFLQYGGIIQEFRVAGKNIVLSLPDEEAYRKYNSPYFGATIGRTTNRIKDSTVSNLNGKSYAITTTQPPNSLHGGNSGWDCKVFNGPKPINRNGKEGMEFRYLSKHGEEGYPGTVELRVWYTAGKEHNEGEHEKTILEVEYEVEFLGNECEETVVGVTNHSYFNLGDSPTIDGTEALLATDKYLPVDSTGIPTGSIDTFTTMKVNEPFFLEESYPDLDECFVMDTDPESTPIDTRSRPPKLFASFKNLSTNIHLEVHSTEPAFQFYTGKYVDVPAVGDTPPRGPRAGFCVEPSRFINAPNEPKWRGMSVLKKGQTWGAKTVYKAWKE